MRVNAGLKSKKELIERMTNGERFKWKTHDIFFREETLSIFDEYKEFEIEKPHHWTDDLKDGPILCRVWNSEGCKEINRYRDIIAFDRRGFLTKYSCYSNAEPVTPDMLWKPPGSN